MTSHIHASCVELSGKGLLLLGNAGAGKSSFALSLINRGFTLVGDDQVCIFPDDGKLRAQPAESLKGLLEVRGIGILQMLYSSSCTIEYLIDLVPGFCAERLPDQKTMMIYNAPLRTLQINPMDPRAIEKILILFHPNFAGFYERKEATETIIPVKVG